MGMGYYGESVSIITNDDMARLLPKQYAELIKIVEEDGDSDIDTVITQLRYQSLDIEIKDCDVQDKIEKAVNKLITAFEQKYPGMSIEPYCHTEEDGDRYDEFFGSGWAVDGVYELTNSAKKIERKLGSGYLRPKSMVYFG